MSKKDIFKRFLPIVIVTILMSACSKTDKKFLITNNSVGELTKSTKIIQLDSLYRNDSLVKTSLEGEFRYISDERFLVFEKGKGKKQLLELTPSIPQEGKPQYIQGVQVLDGRYATDKNISLRSTFGEIKKVYKEFDFEQLISTVVVMPKGSNLFFTFDQNDLLPPLDDTYTIESIPEDAKVKSLMINWVH
ncbi:MULTISPECIES: hypothetical protein [unclassified Capnocytophaga]|jgi:hypothetical protein|uniref:hypothetical protein n=1 Tax=unclassified Capnocytophaga TaxID=2640652 RepID=UPI000202B31E|nr:MULTISPECIES: hypothetical protein [unclassified Capnocytophaga]EGD34077.1 putative secreted protein [Capnocytophaga sp. oral taxon 338 str. F0234]MEB3004387.1 hypothetical protein [Capnocytophaga sp. G2]